MLDLKKQYFKLGEKGFAMYLSSLKDVRNCLHFFDDQKSSYFYLRETEVSSLLLELNKKDLELNLHFSKYPSSVQEMVVQSCLIDEIRSTNITENIFSTHHDVFGLLKKAGRITNRKVASSVNAYRLLNEGNISVGTAEDIRKLYDQMMDGAYDNRNDVPDGVLFRKDSVEVSDGMSSIHHGFYPEEAITNGIKEFLLLYNDESLDIYERMILAHFMFETIHPFYDGNGRLGRLLFSLPLVINKHSLFGYCIASSINREREKYYTAFKTGRDIHAFGCLDNYVYLMLEIMNDGADTLFNRLEECDQKYREFGAVKSQYSLTKTESLIYDLLAQAGSYSYFGVANEDIIEQLVVSKRTVISTMNKFRDLGLLLDTKIGKTTYHRLKSGLSEANRDFGDTI